MEFIQNTTNGSQLDTLSTAATKSAESVIAAVGARYTRNSSTALSQPLALIKDRF